MLKCLVTDDLHIWSIFEVPVDVSLLSLLLTFPAAYNCWMTDGSRKYMILHFKLMMVWSSRRVRASISYTFLFGFFATLNAVVFV